jgi:hypothetical protein
VVTTPQFSKNSRNIDLPVTMPVHTKQCIAMSAIAPQADPS